MYMYVCGGALDVVLINTLPTLPVALLYLSELDIVCSIQGEVNNNKITSPMKRCYNEGKECIDPKF